MAGVLNQIANYPTNRESALYQIANMRDAVVNYRSEYQKGLGGKVCKSAYIAIFKLAELFVKYVLVPLKIRFHAIFELKLLRQINRDKKLLGSEQEAIAHRVDKVCEEEGLFIGMDEKNMSLARDVATATYASTAAYLAPVFIAWSKSLLLRAKEQNLRLVFMARDGLGPYEIAKVLKEQNPEFASVPLHYIYLSRAMVEKEKERLPQYLQQEGIASADRKILFVDIGFLGTTTPGIRQALAKVGIPSDPKDPKNAVEFEYFISTGDKARGYVSNPGNVLPCLQSASSHRGVYWLEATHHGVFRSATGLVTDETKKLVPNTVYQKVTCKEKNPLDFLCVRMAGEALKDEARRAKKISDDVFTPRETLSFDQKEKFCKVLSQFRDSRVLYVSKDNQ